MKHDIQNQKNLETTPNLPHSQLTATILKCCFDVIDSLGHGFLESVYQKALAYALQQKELNISIENAYTIFYQGHKVGYYFADLVVEDLVIVELKCCRSLLPEHKAQIINYLKAADIPIGLLVNFGHKKLEYKRLQHPSCSES